MCASKEQSLPETYQSCSFEIQCHQLQLLLPDPVFGDLEIWLRNSLTFLEGWQPFARHHQSSAYFLPILLIVLSLSKDKEVCIRQIIYHKRRKKHQLLRTQAFDQWKLIKKLIIVMVYLTPLKQRPINLLCIPKRNMSKTCKLVSIFSETSLLASEYSIKSTSSCLHAEFSMDSWWSRNSLLKPWFYYSRYLPRQTSMHIF